MNEIKIVAPPALRLRRSQFMIEYFNSQAVEEDELVNHLDRMR